MAELSGAVVLSTDAIRREAFGDAAVQGPWHDIEALLHQRIREAVAAGTPVIVDATHARRPWRLAITQALSLPAPVEWIGWWLYTPLSTCLQWNQTRRRLVPEPVIREMAAALLSAHRLREIHAVVNQAAGRLADPTAQDLLRELEQRLQWGGLTLEEASPVRAYANHSIISSALVRPDCLASERQAEALETARSWSAAASAWSATSRPAPSPTAPAAASGSGRCSCSSTTSAGIWSTRRTRSAPAWG
ncbi:MAG: AAA family ATPase [Cyanobium sp.]